MGELGSAIFNKKAREKLRSPDDLEKYVRVTAPSTWAVLAAFALLLVGVLAWGVFGTVSTSVTATGVVIDGRAVCFLSAEDAARIHEGDAARVGGQDLVVAEVAKVPSSREEAAELLGSDYLTELLVEGNWATEVSFEGDVSSLEDGVPLATNITCERVAPIMLVFGE